MLDTDRERFSPTEVSLQNGQAVTLRFLTTGDADPLGDFYTSLSRATYRFYAPHPLTREQARTKAASALDPTFVCLVATDAAGQQIVGYAWYVWQDDDSRSSTFGICIRDAYRGIGLGGALIVRLLDVAAHVGPGVMSLTVQMANARALALYRKMGF